MPKKFPKPFSRRKSSSNMLDEEAAAAPRASSSSFRVLERAPPRQQVKRQNVSFDGGIKLARALREGQEEAEEANRPTTSPMRSGEGDGLFAGEDRSILRDSGGAHSNGTSTFTTDNSSSRLSAASTAPSTLNSGEGARPDEPQRVSHPERTYDIPIQRRLARPASSFSLKAAGRTFSFAKGSKGAQPPPPPPPPPLPSIEDSLPLPPLSIIDGDATMGARISSRVAAASAQASLAAPPSLEEQVLDLGGSFARDMFADLERKGSDQDRLPRNADFEGEPAKPQPSHSNMRSHPNLPPRLTIDRSRSIEPSPYSWNSHDSGRDLMAATPSPPPHVYMRPPLNPPPPVPSQDMRQESDNFTSRGHSDTAERSSSFELASPTDEEGLNLLRESYNHSRKLIDTSYDSRPSAKSPTTQQMSPKDDAEDIFDASMAENAFLADRISEGATYAPTPPEVARRNKIMTPAQFERAKQDHERAMMVGGAGSSKDEDDNDDDMYDEDEEEAERLKKTAKLRRQQDAHMTVFRQGMMKSTGETAAPVTGRPTIRSSASTPNLLAGAMDDDSDEDDEVPLAILQAHGFPNKNRPPSQLANVGPSSGANVPIFARNLPPDPYFGASVVNPLNRDPLTFGSGSGSVRGGGAYQNQGLIGVIATEEHNRALRRGSPNPTNGGAFTPQGGGGFGAMGMGVGMVNMHPHAPMPMPAQPMMMMGMPPASPMMQAAPGQTPQDQMDFMRMQMHMMQMQMMNGGLAAPPSASTMSGFRPPTAQSPEMPGRRPMTADRRIMSLIDPNVAPWRNSHVMGSGYAASMAPSERSNIGLPGRYRPVSTAPYENNGSISGGGHKAQSVFGLATGGNESMSVTGAGPAAQAGRAVSRAGGHEKAPRREEEKEEDEEEAWAALKVKREAKRGKWRDRKADEEIKGMLGRFG